MNEELYNIIILVTQVLETDNKCNLKDSSGDSRCVQLHVQQDHTTTTSQYWYTN